MLLFQSALLFSTEASECKGPSLKEQFKQNKYSFIARAKSRDGNVVAFEVEKNFKGNMRNFEINKPESQIMGDMDASSFKIGTSYFFSPFTEPQIEDGKTILDIPWCSTIRAVDDLDPDFRKWLQQQLKKSVKK
jgi:hypothetical protein